MRELTSIGYPLTTHKYGLCVILLPSKKKNGKTKILKPSLTRKMVSSSSYSEGHCIKKKKKKALMENLKGRNTYFLVVSVDFSPTVFISAAVIKNILTKAT